MKKWNNNFESWKDVQNQFSMNEPKPDEVLYADYDCPDYEGSAFVVYRNGAKYYENGGSHCSCYGLEGQWNPESYTKKQYLAVLKRRPEDSVTRYLINKLSK